jgi:hypothetical protein
VFICAEAGEYVDLATLGELTRTTAGSLHYFSGPIPSPVNFERFLVCMGTKLDFEEVYTG